MRIVVVSDAHFDVRTGGVERFGEVRTAFDTAVRFVMSSVKVDLFVFLGDLCDGDDGRDTLRASAYTVAVAVRLMEAGVQSLWVAGNHDVMNDGETTTLEPLISLGWLSSSPFVPVVASVGPVGFPMPGGWHVCALPYSPLSYDAEAALMEDSDVAKNANAKLLVFSHLMLPDMHLGSESGELARGKDRNFPLGVMKTVRPELVVNGHYHEAQTTKDGIHIPGSLARLTFGEEKNTPGFLVFDL